MLGTAAAFGLGALMHAHPMLFDGSRWAAWCSSGGSAVACCLIPEESLPLTAPLRYRGRRFAAAFVTNILNPKVGLFYFTSLPHFIPRDGGSGNAFTLACVHVIIALTCFLTLSALTGSVRRWLRQPSVASRLDQLTGGVFKVFALQLSLSAGLPR